MIWLAEEQQELDKGIEVLTTKIKALKNQPTKKSEKEIFELKVWFQKRPVKAPKGRQINLQKSLILAYQIQKFIKENKVQSLLELGRWTNMSQARICQIMKLLLLSSDIQEEILVKNSDRIIKLTERSIRKITLDFDWIRQGEIWSKILHGAI